MLAKFMFGLSSVVAIALQMTTPESVGLIEQAKQLTLTVAALVAVAVLWRKVQANDARKDDQIESSIKAVVENTAATNKLADKICDLVDKIDDMVAKR